MSHEEVTIRPIKDEKGKYRLSLVVSPESFRALLQGLELNKANPLADELLFKINLSNKKGVQAKPIVV